MKETFTYSIEKFCSLKKCFTVRIYSDKFAHPEDFYQPYNISVLNFEPNKDINAELSRQCLLIAQQIIASENTQLIEQAELLCDTLKGQPVVYESESQEITPEDSASTDVSDFSAFTANTFSFVI